MQIVDIEDEDIKLDENGQPVFADGDFDTVSGDACWYQDLRNESLTEEGELFYEDEEDDEAYGFGMQDFIQSEDDDEDFLKTEIEQRIRAKLGKRRYIDGASVQINILSAGRNSITANISFKRLDDDTIYSLDADTSEDIAEVETEYD